MKLAVLLVCEGALHYKALILLLCSMDNIVLCAFDELLSDLFGELGEQVVEEHLF